MGLEANSSSSTAAASNSCLMSSSTSAVTQTTVACSSGKRSRDPEDEVYVDNLNSHKRYLSEIMASSLNGLTVGDSLPDTLMDSPARDDMPLQYSPMSEDSDECRYFESLVNTCSSQPDSVPTSPVSPYRYQRFPGGFSSGVPTTSYPLHNCNLPVTCPQPRQRGSDSEGRFPSSPSDICHSADLRRAALMRSVQIRTQSPGPSLLEMSFSPGQEPGHSIETQERPCTYIKSLDEREDHIVEGCPTSAISELETREKPCRVLNMDLKGDKAAD